MIKNQRQYEITRAHVARFQDAVNALAAEAGDGSDPRLLRAEREGLESQLQDLRDQVAEYDALKAGEHGLIQLRSISELPRALIQARIAAGMSHRELAERLGVREQQVQRYEATDYSGANLDRLQAVADALGLEIREDILLPVKSSPMESVLRTASKAGIDRNLIFQRFLPRSVAHRIAHGVGEDLRSAMSVADALVRVFGGSLAAWFGEAPMPLTTTSMATVRFKVSASANEARLSAYTVYAHHLALLVLRATEHIPKLPVPTDPQEVREAVLEQYGEISASAVLSFVWSLGIPVLPLKDSGAFHGACWRVNGRNVIVLKQRTLSDSRWLFDLLHEFRHAGETPEDPEFSVIEAAEASGGRHLSRSERIASAFAGAVALGSRAEALAQMAVERANGRMEWLQRAVMEVAAKEGVSQGSLANYVAFRLSLDGQNWWGAAQNLQEIGEDPWLVARDKLLLELDFSMLSPPDRNLLQQALTDEEI